MHVCVCVCLIVDGHVVLGNVWIQKHLYLYHSNIFAVQNPYSITLSCSLLEFGRRIKLLQIHKIRLLYYAICM